MGFFLIAKPGGSDFTGAEARTALRRGEIGFVYQFHHLLPEFSALENIMLPQMIAGLSRGKARNRAWQLLHSLGLSERGEHRPAELSGGEQQRVAIARAVANAPGILLADEPTGNLDPKTAHHVFAALDALVRATGLATLVATHNMELAARMDRRVTLHEGRVVAYDGHTLGTVIPEIAKQIGVSLKRIFCDAGYKGHNAPAEYRFKVYTAGQKRRMTDAIRREMRRRPAIEPVIGHAKSGHRMDRNYLAGQAGDAINAILAAVGYNFRRLLACVSSDVRCNTPRPI